MTRQTVGRCWYKLLTGSNPGQAAGLFGFPEPKCKLVQCFVEKENHTAGSSVALEHQQTLNNTPAPPLPSGRFKINDINVELTIKYIS